MVKTFQIQSSQLISDDQIRLDEKFAYFGINQNWNVFEINNKPLLKLKDILKPSYKIFKYEEGEEYRGVPTGTNYIDEDGEIINWDRVNSVNHPGRLKYKVEKGDILISSLKGAKVPAVLIEDVLEDTVFSNGFYIFKINSNFLNKFLLYILRARIFRMVLDERIYRGIGISAYRERDFLNIRIPMVPEENQKIAVFNIAVIEQEIKRLKLKIRKQQEIIDEVFASEFGYDPHQLMKTKTEKIFDAKLNDYAKGNDLRFDFRFHNAAGRTALHILHNLTKKRVRDYLSEPIKLGAGISPDSYDDDRGEAYYLTMATIKNWKFETVEAHKVNTDFWRREKGKNSICKGDIIIARSGEGTIGKVALIENDQHAAIFCDFTMRIRFEHYDPLFAYYYFRTDLFQTLIESNKKGLGNNTNIFPSQICEFPLLDIPRTRQKIIVSKIRGQLEQQQAQKIKIEQKRLAIEKIIQQAII